eukprot:m.32574 g.32574  ORF g.32574 m.32574 type:complete len:84 (+) comp31671_c0_seq4:2133-2384(+)
MKVRAIRISYTGESGYELYCSSSDTGHLYEALLDVGAAHGIGDFGTYAMTSLRLEKGFRSWGADVQSRALSLPYWSSQLCVFR